MEPKEKVTRERVAAMSRDELLDLRHEVLETIASVKVQLEAARAEQKTTGKYADREWYQKATAALRYMGLDALLIQNALSKRNAADKANRITFSGKVNTVLLSLAREELGEEVFMKLVDKATEIVTTEEEAR